MTLAAYNGHEPLTFSDYLDLETGKTLHAEPGGTYDVAPAGGRVVPDVPEPWFTPVSGESAEAAEAVETAESAEPNEDPETDAPQQF